ncbi:alpha/beta hydrolase [Bacterioplanoides sp. SCSIO 12839]|uniref:alpha/beta hydrolase n=1 Tax=Bacterioplanoides sp. SCSIO 12839 TaxID=2829569 RepID=UPI00210694E5|nr:alpha/beta fold hydrolase [Bacterioplanoides sp. SCSIO 12839]UTW47066.1 alpha/beta fold hydrolase [Bacterioplanoides sp. SCSIO 12839]
MSGISKALLSATLIVLLNGCTSLTSLYFYPQEVWIQTPANLGLEYEDVWLSAADGTGLHAWWIPAQGSTSHTNQVVLYLHGNAENISSHVRSVAWMPERGIDVLALDYRGFGASEGQAIMPGVLQDIEAAAAWIRQTYPDKELVVLGQSIGAALAVNFVAQAGERYQVQALVLEAPFAGFPDIARSALTGTWLGWIFVPATWLIPSDWDPQDKAAQIRIPTLMMHSKDDQVIPVQQGRKVFQNLAGERCWLDTSGPHIASYNDEYNRLISQKFIAKQSCEALGLTRPQSP